MIVDFLTSPPMVATPPEDGRAGPDDEETTGPFEKPQKNEPAAPATSSATKAPMTTRTRLRTNLPQTRDPLGIEPKGGAA